MQSFLATLHCLNFMIAASTPSTVEKYVVFFPSHSQRTIWDFKKTTPFCFADTRRQLMVNCWFGSRWFGFRLHPPMNPGLLLKGIPTESQTTNPKSPDPGKTWISGSFFPGQGGENIWKLLLLVDWGGQGNAALSHLELSWNILEPSGGQANWWMDFWEKQDP